jgi:hypothetical protein
VTQHGSRLNKPVLVVLAHLNKLWAVLAMWHKLRVTSLHEQVQVVARQRNKLPWIPKPLLLAHEALLVRPRRPYNRPGPSEHRLLNKVLLV